MTKSSMRGRALVSALAASVLTALAVAGGGVAGPAQTLVAPRNASKPTISGTLRVGETLTANPGTWSGTLPITYSYRWVRCNSRMANCSSTDRPHAHGTGSVTATTSAGARRRRHCSELRRHGGGVGRHEHDPAARRRAAEHGHPDDRRNVARGRDPHRQPRRMGGHAADLVRVSVAALRLERWELRDHRRRDEPDVHGERSGRQPVRARDRHRQELGRLARGDFRADRGRSAGRPRRTDPAAEREDLDPDRERLPAREARDRRGRVLAEPSPLALNHDHGPRARGRHARFRRPRRARVHPLAPAADDNAAGDRDRERTAT